MKSKPLMFPDLTEFKTDQEFEEAIDNSFTMLAALGFNSGVIQSLIVNGFFGKRPEIFRNAFREWMRAEYADQKKASA